MIEVKRGDDIQFPIELYLNGDRKKLTLLAAKEIVKKLNITIKEHETFIKES